ncbi:MAG: RidA family protein [Rubricella sp.]
MRKAINPQGVRPPFGAYSHGLVADGLSTMLTTSGQLAITTDDTVPEGARAQADLCFSAISRILDEAGMTRADIMRINAFVTDRAHMKDYMAARDAWLGPVDPLPASTLVIVSGFTRPEFLVEVEVTAAR